MRSFTDKNQCPKCGETKQLKKSWIEGYNELSVCAICGEYGTDTTEVSDRSRFRQRAHKHQWESIPPEGFLQIHCDGCDYILSPMKCKDMKDA